MSRVRDRRLQTQHDGDLIAAVLSGTACAIPPPVEGELPARGGAEPELKEERGLARKGEHLAQPLRPRVGEERVGQRPPPPRPLPLRLDGETGDLAKPARVDLEGAASHDLAVRSFGDGVLLDVPAQVVVAPGQEIAGGDVGSHERLEPGNVGERRTAHRNPGQRGVGSSSVRCESEIRSARDGTAPRSLLPEEGKSSHASTSSRICAPRSSSGCAMTRGGISRTTLGPAVATSSCRSRAAATIGAAGSVSSRPHIKPRPRASVTRLPRAAERASRPPRPPPLPGAPAENLRAPI